MCEELHLRRIWLLDVNWLRTPTCSAEDIFSPSSRGSCSAFFFEEEEEMHMFYVYSVELQNNVVDIGVKILEVLRDYVEECKKQNIVKASVKLLTLVGWETTALCKVLIYVFIHLLSLRRTTRSLMHRSLLVDRT